MKKLLLILLTGIVLMSCDIQASQRKRTAIYDQPTRTILLEQSKYDEVNNFRPNINGIIIYYLHPSVISAYVFNPDYFFKQRFKNRRKNRPIKIELSQTEKEYLRMIYLEHRKGIDEVNSSDIFSIVVHN